jgi:hypothetical protein
MTRQDILKEFTVNERGVIQDLGKFENEMLYVPYFWDAYMNGFSDSDDGRILTFKVTPEDRAQFPEISKKKRVVKLLQRDDGFVVQV